MAGDKVYRGVASPVDRIVEIRRTDHALGSDPGHIGVSF